MGKINHYFLYFEKNPREKEPQTVIKHILVENPGLKLLYHFLDKPSVILLLKRGTKNRPNPLERRALSI